MYKDRSRNGEKNKVINARIKRTENQWKQNENKLRNM